MIQYQWYQWFIKLIYDSYREIIKENERCQTTSLDGITVLCLPRCFVRSVAADHFRSVKDQRNLSASRHVNSPSTFVSYAPSDSIPRIGCTGAALTVARGACTCLLVYGGRTYAGLYARDLSILRYIFRVRWVFCEHVTHVSPASSRHERELLRSTAPSIYVQFTRGEVVLFFVLLPSVRTNKSV